ncbi:MAG: hypothetical protein F6J95_026690 [Leptolyngbya sp. SIO1E4]|nr:hypothetical protein [Leptolyngbya sp. SIO1E4]
MRKTLRILSYIGLAIATAVMVVLFANGIPAGPTGSAVALAQPFDDFPENETQFIDFRLDELSFATLTDREKEDQLRDWLLFTLASDHNLTAKEVNQSLYDLSTTRHGYMGAVSNFEYGTTRSLYVGEGEVAALIPSDLEGGQRVDALAHIVDKHRKDLGEAPTSIVVFEYALHPDQQYGLLTRREVLEAETLLTESAGYVETRVKTLNDLQQFMEQIDDLTYAQQRGDALILGGRKLQGRPYRGIRIEDVAAIWQSEDKIRRDFTAFEAKWNAKLNQAPLLEQAQIEEQAHQEMVELGLVSGSGFSLDPVYDYAAFAAAFNEINPGLMEYVASGGTPITEEDIQAAQAGLENDTVVPYLTLVDKLQASEDLQAQDIGAFLLEAEDAFRFQQARYDGDLQGTEVGMVLFYTDLLAKFWSLDYGSSTPQEAVPGFLPSNQIMGKLASIYKQEAIELSSTRLWFGPQDKGFQISGADKSLLFSRNATRIYAASSNPLQPGEETTASARSAAFIGWWNDHYEEVAVYEPEYERLNQIMKWSLLISWLNNAERSDRLEFLKEVQVQRDAWFPNWAKANQDRLQFKAWDSVGFYEPGYLGTTTEAMPILFSESFSFFGEPDWYVYGGVSLADEALFQGRKALSSVDDLDTLAYRSTIDYSSINAVDDQVRFTTLEGTAYQLFDEQPTLASVAAQAKEGSKLRGRLSELANLEFVRDVALTDEGLNISTFVDDTALGQLKTARTGNGFKVGWQGRAIDDGQLLVQQFKQSGQPLETFLQGNPMVAAATTPLDDGSYFIKLQGSDDWMQMAAGGGGRDLPPDWQARVGSFPDDPSGTHDFVLRWVDDDVIQKRLTEGTTRILVDNLPDAPLTPEALIVTLKQRNYPAVAQQIADDPQKVHAIARAHIKAELKNIAALRQNGQTARALQQVDELTNLYGNQPDLVLQKALLDMERQRLLIRRIDPDSPRADLTASQEDFYNAVSDIFSGADEGAQFNALMTDDEVIYIQDSPAFNNVDPTNPIDDAFPFGSEARVYRLESGSIGDAHIGGGGYDEPVAAFLTGSDGSTGTSNTFNLKNHTNIPTGGGAPGEDCEVGAESPSCPRDVYVVIDETTL